MHRGTVAGMVAGAAAVALVAGVSLVWPGLDAQETAKVDTSVWALQTGDGRRYARVNTTIGELDTVRSVTDPSQVAQTDDGAYLFSDGFSKLTRIDAAMPANLDEEVLDTSPDTPAGTTDVVTAGDFVAYRTDSGAVWAGRLSAGDIVQLDPNGSDAEDAPQYSADAIAVDSRGVLFSYSGADGAVLRYDVAAAEVRGIDPVVDEGLAAPQISAAGDDWVIVDAEDGEVRLRTTDAAASAPVTREALLSRPDADGDSVYLADDSGLIRIAVDGSGITVEVPADGPLGAPARPVVHDGTAYAAWLQQGEAGGTLWTSNDGQTPLDYGGEPMDDQRRPVFVTGGDAMILNETRTGWVWTLPGGELVESSQDWSLDDRIDPDAEPASEQLTVVLDPRPPVAEPDAFGVRAGSLTTLPVLMNDHDPNEDVLSIDPASVTGLDPQFGTVSITDDSQRLTVRVAPGASGSATFGYAVTDGTVEGGLPSPPTTVTLTVAEEGVQTAPQWCAVTGCLVPWPQPEVALGGTVTVPVLPGWVDPEGDPTLLLSVENPSGIGDVAASPTGEVIYQHSDDGVGGEQPIELSVTVADTSGQQTTKPLVITVSEEPALQIQSFAVVDTVGAGMSVDVTPHVTGTAGTISLESVRVLDDAAAVATIVGGSASFDFSAQAAGTYRVSFTATDGTKDATGTARITLLPADAPAQLATAPVVAFVHPQQDATLDVFAAVSNPTRRVLLLDDVVGSAEPGATLSVDAVGQNHLRVSGTTATGAAGKLGTVAYSVSDGTDDQGARVEGEATVFLLPPAPELAPIAVDDAVDVRAGAQIDIPVLENDIAPSGGRPALNPATIESSSPAALAFAGGDVLRYLAPEEPGSYAVEYGVYTTGAPALADTATVRIEVLADDANRAPLPERLEGRVLSGESTVIDVDDFGTDPDGDAVTLDRIVQQPSSGAATISADGESIVYSSVGGTRGQVSFRYRVVDALGEAGEGTVRVGVLDSQSNPSPVTYTDYVQVQAGEESTIRVSPLANDVDPTMGAMTVTDVRPDLPENLADGARNPEYDRLTNQLQSVGDSTVIIAAGTEPVTMSFLYDLESSSGNTGRGLIVVRVVRESVPAYPVVSDTVLTAENREDFPQGVDVLADKTSWAGGEISDLSVSLWGDQQGVRVENGELSGSLPEQSRVIPFAVTGEGSAGEVTTYAFLRIPGDDDLSLSLRAALTPPEVDELQSVTFDMARLVAGTRGTDLEVGGEVRASGARAQAACGVETGTTVRYVAGEGAPWTDACQVPVRTAGQEEWTILSVPILVTPLDPQPVLRAGSAAVGPGETATFELRNMTTWQLRENWEGIRYAVDYSGSAFEVSLNGSTVTIVGADRALPGSEEAAIVSVPSHPEVTPVRLILRVSAAPSTMPQGGSVAQQCSQASGSSCEITVVGAPGEVNPLPRTPLVVSDVRPAGACVDVSFAVASSTSVVASWPQDVAGGTCSATFSVQDAQRRGTSGERDGRILLDLQGFPKPPASVAQTAYANGEVTLRVDPGEARLAYPGLSGFVIRSNGAEVGRCAADGSCAAIAAPNGEQRTYEALAVNSVGTSRGSVSTVAWAYDSPPSPTSVVPRPVVTSGGEGGVVSLIIQGIDSAQTASVEISSPAGETIRVPVSSGRDEVEIRSYRVGSNTASPITVTPYSRFELPPGLGGSGSGAAVTVYGNGIGSPRDPLLTLSSQSDGNGSSTITASAAATSGGDGSTLRYGIVEQGRRCEPVEDGAVATFAGLEDGEEYAFDLCVDSWFDGDTFGSAETSATARAQQSGRPPTGWTFVVDGSPNVSDGRAEWIIRDEPRSDERLPNRNRAEISGFASSIFSRDPQIQVRYVHDRWGDATPWALVVPRAGSAPYQVQATWSLPSCTGGSALVPQGDSSADPAGNRAAISFDPASLRYYDQSDAVIAHDPGTWNVPVGAVRVQGVRVTVDWSARGWGLSPASTEFSARCTPNNPAPPPAAPTP